MTCPVCGYRLLARLQFYDRHHPRILKYINLDVLNKNLVGSRFDDQNFLIEIQDDYDCLVNGNYIQCPLFFG
jgi:hypothetical protein